MFSISVKQVKNPQATQFTWFEDGQVGLNQVDRFFVGKLGKLVEFRIQANGSIEENAVNTSHQFDDEDFISVNTNKAVYIQKYESSESTTEPVPTYRYSFENISNPQYINTTGYIIGYISDDDVVFHDTFKKQIYTMSGINLNFKNFELSVWKNIALVETSDHIVVNDGGNKQIFEVFDKTGKMLSYLEAL